VQNRLNRSYFFRNLFLLMTKRMYYQFNATKFDGLVICNGNPNNSLAVKSFD